MLAKKRHTVNYHIIGESVAAGILRVAKEDTKTNQGCTYEDSYAQKETGAHISGLLYYPSELNIVKD